MMEAPTTTNATPDNQGPQQSDQWVQMQKIAYRNIQLKQFFFELAAASDVEKSVQMPSTQYLSVFADTVNFMRNCAHQLSFEQEDLFRKSMLKVFPLMTESMLLKTR